MKNKVMKLGLLAAMVMGGMSAAHAANNTVTVSGQVLATTCDVSVDKSELSLKAKPADMTASATLYSPQQVTVSLVNCQGDGDANSQGAIRLTGDASGLGNTYFNTEQNPVVAIGVAEDNKTTNLLATDSKRMIGSKADDGSTLEGKSLIYNVGLASPTVSPGAGVAKTTLKFDFFYQ
ncbi:MAG: fimbrial protein [Enterobacter ludwigii]|nr:fimbrial protein [Enterobacter ludwigii]